MTTSDPYNQYFVWGCSFLIMLVLLIPTVMAVPTTGAATAIGSNNVTIPATGITGNDVYVVWGNNPGAEVWTTFNQTPTAGAADVLIWGAPLMGNTVYYAKACDSTGCGNEVSFTTAEITPLPTTTFGAGYRNLSASHFNVLYIASNVERVYTQAEGSPYGIPRTMLYGLLLGLVFLGLWLRTRSVRLCSTVGIILGGLLFAPDTGLYLGIPGQVQLLGGILLAAGIAGWGIALWLKK